MNISVLLKICQENRKEKIFLFHFLLRIKHIITFLTFIFTFDRLELKITHEIIIIGAYS